MLGSEPMVVILDLPPEKMRLQYLGRALGDEEARRRRRDALLLLRPRLQQHAPRVALQLPPHTPFVWQVLYDLGLRNDDSVELEFASPVEPPPLQALRAPAPPKKDKKAEGGGKKK